MELTSSLSVKQLSSTLGAKQQDAAWHVFLQREGGPAVHRSGGGGERDDSGKSPVSPISGAQ